MRPKFAQIGRPNGLPKIHKQFVTVPSFQQITDITHQGPN